MQWGSIPNAREVAVCERPKDSDWSKRTPGTRVTRRSEKNPLWFVPLWSDVEMVLATQEILEDDSRGWLVRSGGLVGVGSCTNEGWMKPEWRWQATATKRRARAHNFYNWTFVTSDRWVNEDEVTIQVFDTLVNNMSRFLYWEDSRLQHSALY